MSAAVKTLLCPSDSALHTANPHPQMMGFKSLHPGGVMFALADGSVRVIAEYVDYRLLNELGTRAGGEAAQVP